MIPKKCLMFLAWVISQLCAFAQNDIPSGKTAPNKSLSNDHGNSAVVPSRFSPSSTVEEAAKMLKSGEIEERVGAAKLLGKYPGSQVSLLLVGVLDDSSELVRRAAVVSLVEHFNNGSFFSLGQPLYEKLFSKIGDPDVEVRREVSALIPRLAFRLIQSSSQRTVVNGRVVYQNTPGHLRQDLHNLALQALKDPDAVVRQNMLKYHSSLRLYLGPDLFKDLLGDKDKGVLLEAIEQSQRYGSFEEIQQKFSELTIHPDIGVRTKMCRIAYLLSRSHSFYRTILLKLTEDQSADVATLAIIDLAKLGQGISPEMISRIKSYLVEAKGFYGNAEKLFFTLPVLGSDALKIYQALLDHPSSKMRTETWAKYLLLAQGWDDSSIWLRALNDPDSQVREVVLFTLRGRVKQVGSETLQTLFNSEHPDVRGFGAELLLVVDEKIAQEQFFDFLIDENSLVRATTLRVLARRKLGEWANLHARSLQDDDFEIQRAAADGLLSNLNEGAPLIQEFIKKFPALEISDYLRNELQKNGVKP